MVPGLELLRDHGAAAVAELVPELAADIAAYRVIERRPLEATFGGMRVVTCPPPSRGGAVVAAGLAEIDGCEPAATASRSPSLSRARSSPGTAGRRAAPA